jgi:pimeloyl-ACP methyl ester carboxylesterase
VLIELDGLEAYVEERGSGPPLVLVHGLGGSTAIWQKVADPLAERHRVIAYDLRGLGRSRAAEPAGSLGILTGDLRLLLDRLGLDRVALLGHSLGGAVALAFAAQHAERVSAVVGVAAPSVSPEEQRAHLAERAATALRDGMEPIAALHVERGLPEAFRDAHPGDVGVYRSIIAAGDPIGYAALCGVIADLDLSGHLGTVRAPVLLVQGELDAIVPAPAARVTAAAIDGCRYHELEGCGHVVPFERPPDLVRQALEFLRGEVR